MRYIIIPLIILYVWWSASSIRDIYRLIKSKYWYISDMAVMTAVWLVTPVFFFLLWLGFYSAAHW